MSTASVHIALAELRNGDGTITPRGDLVSPTRDGLDHLVRRGDVLPLSDAAIEAIGARLVEIQKKARK